MKERPILFSGPMVRAILAGQKTQTRRIVKDASGAFWDHAAWRPTVEPDGIRWASDSHVQYVPRCCPYGVPGDRLWVRETFATGVDGCPGGISYRADHLDPRGDGPANPMTWKPSIFMPRAASRLTLEITSVRVERLQDITEADAQAEGVEPFFTRFPSIGREQRITSGELAADAEHRAAFAVLWDEINGDRSLWNANPWVWALSFTRIGGAR